MSSKFKRKIFDDFKGLQEFLRQGPRQAESALGYLCIKDKLILMNYTTNIAETKYITDY